MHRNVLLPFASLAFSSSVFAFVSPSSSSSTPHSPLIAPSQQRSSSFRPTTSADATITSTRRVILHQPKTTLLKALPPSFFASAGSGIASHDVSTVLVASAEQDIGIDDAFTDEINYFGDPTIQLMFGIFGAVMALLLAANALLGQMDGAIQNVLVDFERVMKTRYASRWIEIEEELEGLEPDSPERTEILMKIMERLEREEPKLMEKVNAEMGSYK